MKLIKNTKPLTTPIILDKAITIIERSFDCTSGDVSEFYPWVKPEMSDDFNIGVIVGASGSGKSTLLREFGTEENPKWMLDDSIISQFESVDEGINLLTAVGLNSVPSWYKPYRILSNGEQFRADLARKIKDNAVIDEFTSVVDRNVAKAASVALVRYIRKNNLKNIVLSTCHRDILDWLEPDWVIDTDLGELTEGFFLSDQKSNLTFTEQISLYGTSLKTIII